MFNAFAPASGEEFPVEGAELRAQSESVEVWEDAGGDGHLVGLVRAGRVAGPADALRVLGVGVTPDVCQDPVHAEEAPAGADHRHVVVSQCVEKGHAPTVRQDLVVRGREEAVGETVSEKNINAIKC